jgi:hypothetical protein
MRMSFASASPWKHKAFLPDLTEIRSHDIGSPAQQQGARGSSSITNCSHYCTVWFIPAAYGGGAKKLKKNSLPPKIVVMAQYVELGKSFYV